MPDPNEQHQHGAEATYAQEAAEHPGETYAEQAARQAREAKAREDAQPAMRITDPRIGHMATLMATGNELMRQLRAAAQAAQAMRAVYSEICKTLLSDEERDMLDALSDQSRENFKDSVADWSVQILVDKAITEGIITEHQRHDWDYLAARAAGLSEDEFAVQLDDLADKIERHDREQQILDLKESGHPLAKILGL